jgi:hypothetical protein
MDASAGSDLQSVIELWLATREIDRLADRLRKARDEEIERSSHYATEPAAKKLTKTHADVAARVYHRKKGFMAAFEELVAGRAPRAEPPFLERAKARWPRLRAPR